MKASELINFIIKISISLGLLGCLVVIVYAGFIHFSSAKGDELLKYMANLKFIINCSLALIFVPILFVVGFVLLNAFFKK